MFTPLPKLRLPRISRALTHHAVKVHFYKENSPITSFSDYKPGITPCPGAVSTHQAEAWKTGTADING